MGDWVSSDDKSQKLKSYIQFLELQKLLSTESPLAEKWIGTFIQYDVVSLCVKFIAMDDNPQLQNKAGWLLAYIASGTSEQTKVVIDAGAVPIFVNLLSSPCRHVRLKAVWALGNIAADSTSCRDLVLSHGALIPLLSQFNDQSNLSMLRYAMWTLLKFLRGKPQPSFEQVRPALPALQRLLFSDDEQLLADTCRALSFLSYRPTDDKIQALIDAGVFGRLVQLLLYLVSQGCIKPMCDLLVCPDPKIVTICLEGLDNFLKVGKAEKSYGNTGDDVNLYARMINDAEGLEKIENLQSHDSNEISEKAVKILKTYYLLEDEDETLPPGSV